jgi:GH24 family phage-related lysozyme (muramidase)
MAEPNSTGPGSPSMQNPSRSKTAMDSLEKYKQDTLKYLSGAKDDDNAEVQKEIAEETKQAVNTAKETEKTIKEVDKTIKEVDKSIKEVEVSIKEISKSSGYMVEAQRDSIEKQDDIIKILDKIHDTTTSSDQHLFRISSIIMGLYGLTEQAFEAQKKSREDAEKDKAGSADPVDKPTASGGKRDAKKDSDELAKAGKTFLGGLAAIAGFAEVVDVLRRMWDNGAFKGIEGAVADIGKVGLRLASIKVTGFMQAIEKFGSFIEKLGGDAGKAAGAVAERVAGKGAGQAAEKIAASAVEKEGATTAEKGAARVAEAAAEGGALRAAGRGIGAVARGGAKVLPGIGLALDATSAVDRAGQGDWWGATLDAASGVAGLLPVVGTAAAVGIQGYQAYRDISGKSGYEMGKGLKNIGNAVGITHSDTATPTSKSSVTGDGTVSSADASKTMVDYISKKEGLSLKVYNDVGHYAIGYGHDLTDQEVKAGGVMIGGKLVSLNVNDQSSPQITKEQAQQLLQQDLAARYIPTAKRQLGEDTWNKLSDGQKAAVVDNVYNAGSLRPEQIKQIQMGVASGNLQQAAQGLAMGVTTAGGQQNATLVARRQDEANMFAASGPSATPLPNVPQQGAQLAQQSSSSGAAPIIAQNTNNITVAQTGGGGGGGASQGTLVGTSYNISDVHVRNA